MVICFLCGNHVSSGFLCKLSTQPGLRPQEWVQKAHKRWIKYTTVKPETEMCAMLQKKKDSLLCFVLTASRSSRIEGKALSLSRCCTLWVPIDWPLAPRPFIDPRSWLTFICKAALVPLRYYPGDFVEMAACDQEAASLSVPRRPKSGRRAFVSSVTSAWKPERNESERAGVRAGEI